MTLQAPTVFKILVSLVGILLHCIFPIQALFHYQEQPGILLFVVFCAWYILSMREFLRL